MEAGWFFVALITFAWTCSLALTDCVFSLRLRLGMIGFSLLIAAILFSSVDKHVARADNELFKMTNSKSLEEARSHARKAREHIEASKARLDGDEIASWHEALARSEERLAKATASDGDALMEILNAEKRELTWNPEARGRDIVKFKRPPTLAFRPHSWLGHLIWLPIAFSGIAILRATQRLP